MCACNDQDMFWRGHKSCRGIYRSSEKRLKVYANRATHTKKQKINNIKIIKALENTHKGSLRTWWFLSTTTHTHKHTYTQTHIHTNTHTHKHTYEQTHIHTNTHMHIIAYKQNMKHRRVVEKYSDSQKKI